MIPFERDDNGQLVASLTEPESALLSSLAAQVADMLDELGSAPYIADPDAAALYESVGIGGSTTLHDDPAVARLLPNAYADDLDASRDFRGLTERSLAARKIANARAVVDSLDIARGAGGELRLDAALVQSWMRTLVDIRLTIAARLGITQDEYPGDGGGPDGGRSSGGGSDGSRSASGGNDSDGIDSDRLDNDRFDSDGLDDSAYEAAYDAAHEPAGDESLVMRDVYDWLGWVSESLMEAIE